MKYIKSSFLVLSFLTVSRTHAQDNLLGVYFSDQIKFPGMGHYFNDEVWLSGGNQLYASRTYNRFATGLFYQYAIDRDWVFSVKAGMGIRRLYETYTLDFRDEPTFGGEGTVYTEIMTATYKQNSYMLLPGIYYKIGNDTRITGYGGAELLFNYYDRGSQNVTVDKYKVRVAGADTTGGSLDIANTKAKENYTSDISPGMAMGIGFVAGLKVRLGERIYIGIDISEYFAYLNFKGDINITESYSSNTVTTVGGNALPTAYTSGSYSGAINTSFSQFSFSNVVANLNVSFEF